MCEGADLLEQDFQYYDNYDPQQLPGQTNFSSNSVGVLAIASAQGTAQEVVYCGALFTNDTKDVHDYVSYVSTGEISSPPPPPLMHGVPCVV